MVTKNPERIIVLGNGMYQLQSAFSVGAYWPDVCCVITFEKYTLQPYSSAFLVYIETQKNI
jgi:hypothetical protein